MESYTDIHVGIIRKDKISFHLSGSFEISGIRKQCTGSCEARTDKGKIIVQAGPDRLEFEGEVSFIPGDFSGDHFEIREVVIGIDFHWEQKEDQRFQGVLKLLMTGNEIQVINILPVESYLCSVISSEMSANSSLSLLKAHAIISRSWVLTQLDSRASTKQADAHHHLFRETETEYIRWYDHSDHRDFHVCADDHCQRYQGITRIHNPNVIQAVGETHGQVLMYDNKICDTRYSKSCGGVSELFENSWEDVPHPYLQKVIDNHEITGDYRHDLKVEKNAVAFISKNPDAFCNTKDESVLSQVLNDYDLSSRDFFRWKVRYSQQELSSIIADRSGIDFGKIKDLIPVERGESARLIKLQVVGTRKTLTIGKELIIRKWLSRSHLYSSAFSIEKKQVKDGIPGEFILHGAGWGHGVGLCQIGAAVMAEKGYSHEEILKHYFRGAIIRTYSQ